MLHFTAPKWQVGHAGWQRIEKWASVRLVTIAHSCHHFISHRTRKEASADSTYSSSQRSSPLWRETWRFQLKDSATRSWTANALSCYQCKPLQRRLFGNQDYLMRNNNDNCEFLIQERIVVHCANWFSMYHLNLLRISFAWTIVIIVW